MNGDNLRLTVVAVLIVLLWIFGVGAEVLMGFTLLRFTSKQVFDGTALGYVERAIWLLREEK